MLPNFKYTNLDDGLKKLYSEFKKNIDNNE